MEELEKGVREIEMDGLVWGASKLVPVGFGIKKLQINLVIEDEKVSLDELQQRIEGDEDHVQSTDVVSSSDSATDDATKQTDCGIGCYAKAMIRDPSYHARSSTGKGSGVLVSLELYFSSSGESVDVVVIRTM